MGKKAAQEEGYVQLTLEGISLQGNLLIPEQAKGLVAFAHGSGSSRHSSRNQYVARVLRDAGLATLLFDLLTMDEEAEDLITGKHRFDISLLARRLVGATDWLQSNELTRRLRLGYFGASTGAAAALVAAAERTNVVGAVVSRGGRPDLAEPLLDRVQAPTLLIVGGNDFLVIDMNRQALDKLNVEKKLVIVPGATHLFEEPGTLEQVARLASDWFVKHLAVSLFYIKKLFKWTLRDFIMHHYKVYQRLVQVKDNEFHLKTPNQLTLTRAFLKTGYTMDQRIV